VTLIASQLLRDGSDPRDPIQRSSMTVIAKQLNDVSCAASKDSVIAPPLSQEWPKPAPESFQTRLRQFAEATSEP